MLIFILLCSHGMVMGQGALEFPEEGRAEDPSISLITKFARLGKHEFLAREKDLAHLQSIGEIDLELLLGTRERLSIRTEPAQPEHGRTVAARQHEVNRDGRPGLGEIIRQEPVADGFQQAHSQGRGALVKPLAENHGLTDRRNPLPHRETFRCSEPFV